MKLRDEWILRSTLKKRCVAPLQKHRFALFYETILSLHKVSKLLTPIQALEDHLLLKVTVLHAFTTEPEVGLKHQMVIGDFCKNMKI